MTIPLCGKISPSIQPGPEERASVRRKGLENALVSRKSSAATITMVNQTNADVSTLEGGRNLGQRMFFFLSLLSCACAWNSLHENASVLCMDILSCSQEVTVSTMAGMADGIPCVISTYTPLQLPYLEVAMNLAAACNAALTTYCVTSSHCRSVLFSSFRPNVVRSGRNCPHGLFQGCSCICLQ